MVQNMGPGAVKFRRFVLGLLLLQAFLLSSLPLTLANKVPWEKRTSRIEEEKVHSVRSRTRAPVRLSVGPVGIARLVKLPLNATDEPRAPRCLDGSPGSYFIRPGVGQVADKWLIVLQGGGWCDGPYTCGQRVLQTPSRASSNGLPPTLFLDGVASFNRSVNPDFWNWTTVFVNYCDGGSFAGSAKLPVASTFKTNLGVSLFFRGRLILKAVMDSLVSAGLQNATEVLLWGQSAGSVSASIHGEFVRSRLRAQTKMARVLDSGFFVDRMDVTGNFSFRASMQAMVEAMQVTRDISPFCKKLRQKDLYRCFFQQYFASQSKIPTFLIRSNYDVWEIQNVVIPLQSVPQLCPVWCRCLFNLFSCTQDQRATVLGVRNSTLQAVSSFQKNPQNGWALFSCFTHTISVNNVTWPMQTLQGKAISSLVSDWYFGKKSVRFTDVPYPNGACGLPKSRTWRL